MFFFWGGFLLFLSFLVFVLSLLFLKLMAVFLCEYILWEVSNLEFKIFFLFDWMSLLFLSVVLFISGMVIIYSEGYMKADKNKIYFLYGVLLFVTSMNLMILSPNLIMMLMGWDGLGLVSYCLVIYYQNVGSESAGMVTVLSNRVGDVMILLSIVLLFNFGMVDFMYFKKIFGLVGVFMIVAGMTKSAQVPFSAWLPMAMSAPTPVSSLVHSSTLVTAGVYLLIRFSLLFNVSMFSMSLLYVSLITMLMAGVGAMFETDLKKIIAFSTLSQLGLMMMVLSVGMKDLSFFHLLCHALFKAMLFLCAGLMIHNCLGSQDIRFMGAFFYINPLLSGMFGLASLSLFGFPFLSGFYSKDVILEYIYMNEESMVVLFLLILATICTGLYSLRLLYYSVWSGLINSSSCLESSFLLSMEIPILIMSVFVIFFGCMVMWLLFPCPLFFFLKYWVKNYNNFILLVTFWFFLIFYFDYKLLVFGFGEKFFSSLFYLSKMTGLIFMKLLKNGFVYGKMELEWSEEVGPKGVYKLSKQISVIIQWFQMTDVFFFILFSLFYLIVIFF
nr:NADH dehydrogenase subunit 5 [Ogadenus brumpti ssp. 1 BJM-2017]UYB77918.1 NADH dehydrogenase subunit 5 [Ogadenus brumpti]